MRILPLIAAAAAFAAPPSARADESDDARATADAPRAEAASAREDAKTARDEARAARAGMEEARADAARAAARAEVAGKQTADLRMKLAAAEESAEALRTIAADRERESAAAAKARDGDARRLEQALTRLASATQAAAASDAQLVTLVGQSRDDARRMKTLESEIETLRKALSRAEDAAAAPAAPAGIQGPAEAAFRDYQAALDARTRENLALKTRLGQLETKLDELTRPGAPAPMPGPPPVAEAPLPAPQPAAPALSADERNRMNALFEDEKKTLLLLQATTEEHLEAARLDLVTARRRIAELEKALTKRGTLEAEVLTLGNDLDAARREAREAHGRASSIARDKAATAAEAERVHQALAEAEREIASLRGQLKARDDAGAPPP